MNAKWLALIVGCVAAFLLHIALGSGNRFEVLAELFHGPTGQNAQNTILWDIRLPRACAALLVGAILATVGNGFQLVFRNSLAEPYVVGVSGGAALGGSIAVATGFATQVAGLGTPIAAVVGGLLALFCATRLIRNDVISLLIGGVVVGSFLSSAMMLVLVLSGRESNQILGWLLGSLTPMFWPKVLTALVVFVGYFVFAIKVSNSLNLVAVNHQTAKSLGVNVDQVVKQTLWAGTIASSVSVGIAGMIGFLGLISPHIARGIFGNDARKSIPASALIGSALLLLSDLIAQRLVRVMELPVGVVTSVIGAIVLAVLLKKKSV